MRRGKLYISVESNRVTSFSSPDTLTTRELKKMLELIDLAIDTSNNERYIKDHYSLRDLFEAEIKKRESKNKRKKK